MIKKDVDFLADLGFMDYSLLIGIETLSEDIIQQADDEERLDFFDKVH